MNWKVLGLAFAMQIAAAVGAHACDLQTGSVVFQDKFTDDSGGWDFTPPVNQVKPPDFLFTLTSKIYTSVTENLTFNSTFGDYCMDFVLPKSIAADNTVSAGLIALASDYNNYYLFLTYSNGTVTMFKKIGGNYTVIFTVPTSTAFNAAPDAINSLRVVATNDQKLTITLNGQPIKVIRVQAPPGALAFGIFVQCDKAPPADTLIRIKQFSVTSGS